MLGNPAAADAPKRRLEDSGCSDIERLDGKPKRWCARWLITWVARSLGLHGQCSPRPSPLPDSEAAPIPLPEHDRNAPPSSHSDSKAPPEPDTARMQSPLCTLAPTRIGLYGMDLKRYGSKAELYQKVNIVFECESLMKRVMILRGENHDTYIMATEDLEPGAREIMVVPAHQVLGGFGEGTLVQLDDTVDHHGFRGPPHCVPWSLPQGDQTVVSYKQDTPWFAGELNGKMYHVLRMMDRRGQSDLDIAGLGRASRTSQYNFHDDFQDDSGKYPPKYIWRQSSSTCPLGFHLREIQPEPYDSKNCFAPGSHKHFKESQQDIYAGQLFVLLCAQLQASKQKQTHKGALQVQWRIEHERGKIEPVIPRMATQRPILLAQGMPVRVA